MDSFPAGGKRGSQREIQHTRRNQHTVAGLEDEGGHEPRNVGRL